MVNIIFKKILGPKNFGFESIWDQTKFGWKQIFGPKIVLNREKNYVSKIMLDQKNIRSTKNLVTKENQSKKDFSYKKFGQK